MTVVHGGTHNARETWDPFVVSALEHRCNRTSSDKQVRRAHVRPEQRCRKRYESRYRMIRLSRPPFQRPTRSVQVDIAWCKAMYTHRIPTTTYVCARVFRWCEAPHVMVSCLAPRRDDCRNNTGTRSVSVSPGGAAAQSTRTPVSRCLGAPLAPVKCHPQFTAGALGRLHPRNADTQTQPRRFLKRTVPDHQRPL